jgi:hypothetical protein
MNFQELINTARALLSSDKGLLALGEAIRPATNDLQSWEFLRPWDLGALGAR